MDAAIDDSDVKLMKVSGGLFDVYFDSLPAAIFTPDGAIRDLCNRKEIERLRLLVRRFT